MSAVAAGVVTSLKTDVDDELKKIRKQSATLSVEMQRAGEEQISKATGVFDPVNAWLRRLLAQSAHRGV